MTNKSEPSHSKLGWVLWKELKSNSFPFKRNANWRAAKLISTSHPISVHPYNPIYKPTGKLHPKLRERLHPSRRGGRQIPALSTLRHK